MTARHWKLAWVAAALIVVPAVGATIYVVRSARLNAHLADPPAIVPPTRRPMADAPADLPELPPNADAITPMTLVVVLRQDGGFVPGTPIRQTVTRTAERIHVQADDRREWLFERISIDPRRATAALVDHPSRTIVLYDESDLRITRHIRGWADALMLGFDRQHLGRYASTIEIRTTGVVQFVRYRESGGRAGHLWWSPGQALASDFAITDAVGRTHVSVESAVARVDHARLLPPPHRFPSYRVLDLADWLEKH
jgi:hypothetical protein